MSKYAIKFLAGYFIKDHYRSHLKRHIKEMLSGELLSVGFHLLLLRDVAHVVGAGGERRHAQHRRQK